LEFAALEGGEEREGARVVIGVVSTLKEGRDDAVAVTEGKGEAIAEGEGEAIAGARV
jgi:hypothetical protein